MKVVSSMDYDVASLSYTKTGNGKTIIFLHGWGQSKDFFTPVVSLFAPNYTCICLDLPGWGNSPLKEALEIDDYIYILNEFVKRHKIDLYALIGHSWGGKIAFGYALKHKVDKLVLVSASVCSPRFSLRKQFKILKYKLYKKLVKNKKLNKYLKPKIDKMGSSDYLNAKGLLRNVLVKSVNTYYDDKLIELKVPTLIYWGEKDKETPLYMAKKMHKEIINSKLKIVKNGDHFVLVKCRYNFTVVTSNFLKEGK